MRKHSSLSVVLFFCFAGPLLAQNNPFESLGAKNIKVLTLSNGKYNEFFDNDTIVQIGTVLFNTVTNQVVAFVKTDTSYSEANLKPEITSRWLSPDPLAHQFPAWSPYNYVSDNPILNIDKLGLSPDDYKVDKQGNISLAEVKPNDPKDHLYASDDKGNIDKSKSIEVDKGVLDKPRTGELKETDQITKEVTSTKYNYYETNSDKSGTELFEFVARNSNVEWSQTKFTNPDQSIGNYVGTSHQEHESATGLALPLKLSSARRDVRENNHSHLNGTHPSGFYSGESVPLGGGDAGNARTISTHFPGAKFNVYDVQHNSYIPYNTTGILTR